MSPAPSSRLAVAVLIPCFNEAPTVAGVVRAFREELPDAAIYVFDNNSTDRTVEEATAAGATVMHEPRQGKGHVVQAMFRRIRADVYVMVDGDGTYPADAVKRLIQPIIAGEAEMVIGSRLGSESRSEFRWLNRAGNRLFLWVLASIFNRRIGDLLSGYRAFSRKFVVTTPLFVGGFDTEAEMTIRALAKRLEIVEVPVHLSSRPSGSYSKIRIVRDGFAILRSMLALFRDHKPLTFFGSLGLILIALGLVPGVVVITEYLETGLILRMPSALLAVGLVLSGLIFAVVGVILHVIAQRFQELDFQLQALSSSIQRPLDPF
jgi:glycosyltransferase involved in cell wall biosynthesis